MRTIVAECPRELFPGEQFRIAGLEYVAGTFLHRGDPLDLGPADGSDRTAWPMGERPVKVLQDDGVIE